ncbi:MAG TPA: diaminobutyrate--2-oxoglutarate transaminase, partial [Chitinophaga sp.]|nr:diaminobutyrate--2-oxoglutarate transaminase [Chitinophaga sp.]
KYLDFFCGAGALNYGHNNPRLKQALLSFLEKDAVVHCLDMNSAVKDRFLESFESIILKPRDLNYKVQFTGPTGTNAVEAAVKLARLATRRRKVISFTHSFHGMTATSLALSGSREEKHKVNPAQDVIFFPYDGFFGEGVDTMDYLKKMITTRGTGVELPAAIILETIQAEGGVNVASNKWLQDLRRFTQENEIVLIADDIQVGCGRAGYFFSFERAGIVPDIVLLSKSISGYGLPLSLLLMKPELDVWKPGEHNGTFRSNNMALCTATEALEFWKDNSQERTTAQNAAIVKRQLEQLAETSEHVVAVRGIGMIWGLEFTSGAIARKISSNLFSKGMIIETCGNNEQVIKLLPALTISEAELRTGLSMLAEEVLALDNSVIMEHNSLVA